MLDVFLDYVKKIFKSRLFPITVVYLILFAVIINQLFVIQIVKGPEIVIEDALGEAKTRDIKSTRGNIYDRNGVLLASNQLSYSVAMENVSASSDEYNTIIDKLVKTIEKNGDTLDTEFYIRLNEAGEFEFTLEGTSLKKFIEKVYEYYLVDHDELDEEQKNATAKDIYEFLRYGSDIYPMFGISEEYTDEEALKIMSVRYALYCNYPKYLQITVASKISDVTVAAILENRADLLGVEIQQETSRVYSESEYFAHIIGYTGKISAEELENPKNAGYTATDTIGKTGLESWFEADLAGKKGEEKVTVTNGKVTDIVESTPPVAGNDLYLTIDAELQKNTYLLLEREITKILLKNIVPERDNYGSKGESASEIKIPIYEVYYALFKNNIIDISAFDDSDATTLEKNTLTLYETALEDVFASLDVYLSLDNTTPNDQAGEMEDFLNYFYKELTLKKILVKSNIPEDDATFSSYSNGDISLSAFLQHALANNWIDLSALNVGDEYYSADELYQNLISYTKNLLKEDKNFNKLIYRNLVFSYKLSDTEICLLLFDQGVLKYNEEDYNHLKDGYISAYNFLRDKIENLEITPGMLALEPCSGSAIIIDVHTGEVLAMVTYPSYDNNRLANKIDSGYYTKLLQDNSFPLNNYAVKTRIAPGSTFKMVTSVTALEEGVTTPAEHIDDEGEFTKITPAAKCHIFPGSHGSVDIVEALKVSCNFFFYEMGWRLSGGNSGNYNSDLGLSKLANYAALFGLDSKSGVELEELPPEISSEDAVRSAIGQGSNDYTPAQLAKYVTTIANRGTCYNLTLLGKIKDKDGKVVKDNTATVSHTLSEISASTWDAVFQGMYSVVNESNGSVEPEFKDFGIKVAGKTGTSQVSKNNPNNALFVSFAPYENPEISVTTVIPRGYTSHNAAELSKKIYSLYFGMEDIQTLLNSYTETSSDNDSTLE